MRQNKSNTKCLYNYKAKQLSMSEGRGGISGSEESGIEMIITKRVSEEFYSLLREPRWKGGLTILVTGFEVI